jgi:hypothetical protein
LDRWQGGPQSQSGYCLLPLLGTETQPSNLWLVAILTELSQLIYPYIYIKNERIFHHNAPQHCSVHVQMDLKYALKGTENNIQTTRLTRFKKKCEGCINEHSLWEQKCAILKMNTVTNLLKESICKDNKKKKANYFMYLGMRLLNRYENTRQENI